MRDSYEKDKCEYSYYIDNYYRCTLNGQVCQHSIPDSSDCALYDIEEKKRRKRNNGTR